MKYLKNITILSLFILLLCPFGVQAASEPTKNFYSYIEVQEDGSIKVREIINLSGSYNGLTRDILYRNSSAPIFTGELSDLEGSDIYNGSGISDIKIGAIDNDNLSFDNSVEEFSQVSSASNGQSGVYTMYQTSDGISLKIFNPSSRGQAFYIEYTVEDVVVVHNDVAEIAWNVLGDGYQENIGDFQVKVVLPGNDNRLRTWLHGPLNGQIDPTNNGAEASYDFLGAYNAVSVRLTFNKSLVPAATKFSGMDAEDAIVDYETELARIANEERERIRQQNHMIIISSLVWLGTAIILTIVVFKKSKDSKKTNFSMQYYRDFPADYGPEVLQYLLEKKIDEKSLSATILNLIYKKVLTVEEIEGKKKKDYKLLKEEATIELTEQEKTVLHLLIDTVGNGQEVILSGFQKYGSSLSRAQDFMQDYNDFLKESKKAAQKEAFYQSYPGVLTGAVIVCFLGFMVSFIGFVFEVGFWPAYLAGLIGLVLAIMNLTRRFYTPKGAEHYAKWMAHKRFLEDFSRFDEKELPEVILWDKYLVYATILGCADELSKQMEVKINAMDTSSDTVIVGGYHPFLHSYMLHSAIYSSVNQSVHSAVASSRSAIAASRSSSGGGFGGGSVGGGGSFGGGGGGGRF